MSHYEILASCFHAVLSKLAMLHHCVMKLQGNGKRPTTRKEHCAPTLYVCEIVKILTRCQMWALMLQSIHPSSYPARGTLGSWVNTIHTIKIKCNFVTDGRRMPPKMC